MKCLILMLISLPALICFATDQNNNKQIPANTASISMTEILGGDGSLQIPDAFSGTVDISGYDMLFDENLAPRFVASESSDPEWCPFAGPCGLAGTSGGGFFLFTTQALAIEGSNIYAGGNFTIAGQTQASNIARWDGTQWNALHEGLNDEVEALIVIGSDVYVGGSFTNAGGIADADYVAKWNGSNWSALGSGVNGTVYALETDGTNLYVGGSFSSAGGASVNNLAVWSTSGNSWSDVGGGTNNTIFALHMNGDLYAGGSFTMVGGSVSADKIAKWNGSNWSALASGLSDDVFAIESLATDIYVGGQFKNAGGISNADHFAKWNGSNWSAVGSETISSFLGGVRSIAVSGSDIYISGDFTSIGSIDGASRIARWDGADWNSVGGGLGGTAPAILVDGTTVYAGITPSEGGIRKFEGTDWGYICGPDAGGVGDNVSAIAYHNGVLYVGGSFSTAGNIEANNIAMWDGISWSALGSGTDGSVSALLFVDDTLIVGGNFDNAGGNPASHIAKWTSSWSPLGGGLDNDVNAIVLHDDQIIAGGSFSEAIAAWDGNSWNSFDGGFPFGLVNALATDGSTLYAGGFLFETANSVAVNNISAWDGVAWSAMGSGMNNGVETLLYHDNILYAGGGFTLAGGVSAKRIAQWDGANWSAMGNGFSNGFVFGLAAVGDSIYAGGDAFSGNFSVWDGTTWATVGSGVSDLVDVVVSKGSDVYIGGSFLLTGGESSAHISKWSNSGICVECEAAYTLSGPLMTSTDYETDGIIQSTQIISGDSNVMITYNSGTAIELGALFEVGIGPILNIFIDGCGGLE